MKITANHAVAASRHYRNGDILRSLSDIQQMAQIHLEEKQDTGEQSVRLERARGALARTMKEAHKIIEMIQYFRATESEEETATAARQADIHESVQQVLHAMTYEFPLQRITILKILPHGMPPLPVSREHLDTILFQLILGARKAIGNEPGVITVEAEERMCVSPENTRKRHFEIRISDTGPQILAADLVHIFDPLFFYDERRSGLGLYIVKKLVELNKGQIRVESGAKGTSFYLEFAA